MKRAKALIIFSILILWNACGTNTSGPVDKSRPEEDKPAQDILMSGFQEIIDSVGVHGSILIYDPQQHLYYSNNFEWAAKGFLPASTFKIPNSIIALETGVVKDLETLFIWDGQKRRLSVWEKDMNFQEAFHASCVPCYQDIARSIGVKKMREYLDRFQYGNMLVDSATIDLFWLEGESKISQYGQIEFLELFYSGMLPISQRSFSLMKELMVIEKTGEIVISGKTGWSIRNGNNNGWFVGYVEKDDQVYYFATNIVPRENFSMDLFASIRKDITYKAMESIGILQ
jgi:beta-lactamase class D